MNSSREQTMAGRYAGGSTACGAGRRWRRRAALTALVALWFGAAAAPSATAQDAPPAAASLAPSPADAGLLSFVTTSVPVAGGLVIGGPEGLGLFGAGLLFGPLSGYGYGHVMDRGLRGLGLRAMVAGGATIAIVGMCQLGDCDPFESRDVELSSAALVTALLATGFLVGSAAIDMLSVPEHVRRANEARAEPSVSLTLVPVVSEAGVGLGVGGYVRF